MYGINTKTSGVIIVSATLRGAKIYATRNGYSNVYYVSPYSMTCSLKAKKEGKKWVELANVWSN